ncbi:hypothetical protein [Gymnodinialimonas hymeniacidonis]|uniref:hypothetical protein n=1 Tax=Gymnodinialimonas hymeniacidonis TaxID=3126508 RepID=UPI0034C5E2B2
MRSTSLILAAVAASLSACVIVDPLPVTGPSVAGVPTTAPQGASLAQRLSGAQLINGDELHRLMPGGQVAGRFYYGPSERDFNPVNGTWSVNGNNFCFGVEVSEPFCGPAQISGNTLTHYSDGGTMIWTIE